MAQRDFIAQLQELGHQAQALGGDRVAFAYVIPVGRLRGQQIRLGLIVRGDFPLIPPSGPHVSPRLLQLNQSADPHPVGGVHLSPDFGEDWQYWSRPFPEWDKGERTVRRYMAHVRHLFEAL